MTAHIAIGIFSILCLFLPIRQNVCLYPLEGTAVSGCRKLIHLLEIQNKAIPLSSLSQNLHPIEIGVNDFGGSGIFNENLYSLLRGEQEALMSEHLAIKTALWLCIARKGFSSADISLIAQR